MIIDDILLPSKIGTNTPKLKLSTSIGVFLDHFQIDAILFLSDETMITKEVLEEAVQSMIVDAIKYNLKVDVSKNPSYNNSIRDEMQITLTYQGDVIHVSRIYV